MARWKAISRQHGLTGRQFPLDRKSAEELRRGVITTALQNKTRTRFRSSLPEEYDGVFKRPRPRLPPTVNKSNTSSVEEENKTVMCAAHNKQKDDLPTSSSKYSVHKKENAKRENNKKRKLTTTATAGGAFRKFMKKKKNNNNKGKEQHNSTSSQEKQTTANKDALENKENDAFNHVIEDSDA